MSDLSSLSQAEQALVIELLQRERDELPVEIHHCRVAAYRDELRRRLEMVQHLLDRLRVPIMA